jgi:hypothetical protein
MRKSGEVIAEPNPRESVAFTAFDADTGEILRSGSSQRQDLHRQAFAANEIVIEGRYPDDRYRIEIGEDGPVAVSWTPPVIVTADMVKIEARRRIEARYPLWKQVNIRASSDAREVGAMTAYIDAVRARSNEIEAMTPLPEDYRDEKWWTEMKQLIEDQSNA